MIAISPEKELILRLSQLAPSDKACARALYLLEKGVDWKYLYSFCQLEGVAGLLWRNLNRLNNLKSKLKNNLLPFRHIYNCTLQANLKLLQDFESLLKYFIAEEIPIILLQGAALLEMVYHDLGQRALGDIDILVREDDMEKLYKLLREQGLKNIKHYPSLFSGKGILLDIHCDIANLSRISSRRYSINIPSETLWQSSIAIKPYQPLVKRLSIEDMILALCAHLQKHSYDRLIWFVDIRELMRIYQDTVDWQMLITRANQFNLIKPLYFSLNFIAYHWPSSKVFSLLSQMQDIELNFIEQKALSKIKKLEKIDRWGDILYLFNIKRTRDKFYFMMETLFPRPKIMSQIFNISKPGYILFAYPLRLWQLIFFFIKSFIRWLFKWNKTD